MMGVALKLNNNACCPVIYLIPASNATPEAFTFDIDSEINFTFNPPEIELENCLEYARLILVYTQSLKSKPGDEFSVYTHLIVETTLLGKEIYLGLQQ